MRSARFGLLLSILLVTIPVCAQVPLLGPPPPIAAPVRDAQAITVVQNAISALGGSSLIGQAQSWLVQGNMTSAPEAPIQSGSFVWKAAGTEFRFEVTTPTGSYVFVTGHGNPARTTNGTTIQLAAHIARAMFVPALLRPVLLRELQDPNFSIRYSGVGNTAGASVVMVTTAAETTYPDNVVTPQVWYIDSSTGLPVRVEFRAPDGRRPGNFLPVALDFSRFSAVSGVLYPMNVIYSVNGNPVQMFTVNSIQINSNVSSGDFDGPAGGAL
jgi:hypothetical protein